MPLTVPSNTTVSDDGLSITHSYTESDATAVARHILNVFDPPEPSPEPSLWDKVVLQTDFEGPTLGHQAVPLADQTSRHLIRALYCSGGVGERLFGSYSCGTSNTAYSWVDNHPLLDLASAETDEFTIEYWLRQSTIAGYDTYSNASGSYSRGFALRHSGADFHFAWFDPSGVHRQMTIPSAGWVASGAGTRVAFTRNSSGRYRLFINGVCKHAQTIAGPTGVVRPSGGPTRINMSAAGGASWMDALRVTRACLYNNDVGYVLASAAFPVGSVNVEV